MRLIVAGPRDLYPADADFERAITRVAHEANRDVVKIITADAPGVERCAWHYAIRNGIPAYLFEAHHLRDKDTALRKAQLTRDAKMLEEGDALLVLRAKRSEAWDCWHITFLAQMVRMSVYSEEVEVAEL